MGSEWQKLFIGSLGKIVTGKTPSTCIDSNFGGQIPFVTPCDLDGSRMIIKTERYLSDTGALSIKNAVIPPNTVMVSCIGSDMGKVAIAGKRCVTNQQINSIIVDNQFDYRYIYYNLSARKDEIRGQAGGSAQPILNKSHFSQLDILLPSLPKQRAIANILSTLDDKIELNRQMNSTLESMAQAMFKSWFIDFDPVIDNALAAGSPIPELLKSRAQARKALGDKRKPLPQEIQKLFPDRFVFTEELGWIPEGWCFKSLDEIANYQNGLALQKFRPEDENDFLPVVKIAHLKKGYADGEEKASPNIKPECIIDDGDVVFSWSGSLMVDVWCGGKAALNQHLFKVTSLKYPKWFYYEYTKHHLSNFQRIAADKAVTMGHIKKEHLSQAACIIPPPHFFEKCSRVIGTILEKQIKIRIESKTINNLRDTLLPKLISGRLSLPDSLIDKFAEQADSHDAEQSISEAI